MQIGSVMRERGGMEGIMCLNKGSGVFCSLLVLCFVLLISVREVCAVECLYSDILGESVFERQCSEIWVLFS